MDTCKLGEKGCWKDGKCHYIHDCENKVFTNADRIRNMSDEELAKKLQYMCPVSADCIKMSGDCKACWLDWLQRPAEEE